MKKNYLFLRVFTITTSGVMENIFYTEGEINKIRAGNLYPGGGNYSVYNKNEMIGGSPWCNFDFYKRGFIGDRGWGYKEAKSLLKVLIDKTVNHHSYINYQIKEALNSEQKQPAAINKI